MLRIKLQQLEYYSSLFYKKKQLQYELGNLPEGWLVQHKWKSGRTELYQHTYTGGVRKQKYLSLRRDRDIIEALKNKHEKEIMLKRHIEEVEWLICKLRPVVEQLVTTTTLPTPVFPPFFSESPFKREELIWITERGEKVRSKSEKFIADTLYTFHLDYKYEKQLRLSGRDYYPDFTIVSPLNGQIYYWEHLGLKNDEYLEKWKKRKKLYQHHNIVQGYNLIVTIEEDLNSRKEIVEDWFTLKHYINLK